MDKAVKAGCYFVKKIKADGSTVTAAQQNQYWRVLEGALINGRYRLDEVLGCGSFGQGWKACDIFAAPGSPNKVVFLKTFMYQGTLKADIKSMTEQDAKEKKKLRDLLSIAKELKNARSGIALNLFNHPNVVRYLDSQFSGTAKFNKPTVSGKDNYVTPSYGNIGFPFLITEFVLGVDVQEYQSAWFTALWYRQCHPMTSWPRKPNAMQGAKVALDKTGTAQHLFVDLMTGLQYLHGAKCYAWDIKPDNLLITKADERLKILDFGMGKVYTEKKVDTKKKVQISMSVRDLPGRQAPELSPGSMGGVSRGTSLEPSKIDIFLAGQLLLGMTVTREYLKYMVRDQCYELPALNVDKGASNFTDLLRMYPNIRCRFDARSYSDGPALKDLLARVLDTDPSKRPSATEVLKHKWCNTSVADISEPQTFKVGDAVEANYGSPPTSMDNWYRGKIAVSHGDGTYDIAYDDGDSEEKVSASDIRQIIALSKADAASAAADGVTAATASSFPSVRADEMDSLPTAVSMVGVNVRLAAARSGNRKKC